MIDLETLEKGLAVDIDETLSWTIGHLIEKMQENFGNPENLSVKEMAEKYRYTQNIPYWQSTEALQWLDEKIHSNEMQEELPLIADANIHLNHIAKIIPISAYITVRPESIEAGTKKWLAKHNFPQAPIIFRPKEIKHQDGNKWKAGILKTLYPKVLGIIDDNAKLLEFLDQDYPGTIFLYDHESANSTAHVIPCKNWLRVFAEVKKHFNK